MLTLQVFIDAKYKNAYGGRHLNDEEITGMLIAGLFAGQHTSSITSAWTGLTMVANQVGQTPVTAVPSPLQESRSLSAWGLAACKSCTKAVSLQGACASLALRSAKAAQAPCTCCTNGLTTRAMHEVQDSAALFRRSNFM